MSFNASLHAVPTLLQDDEVARITRWDFLPGAATGWHTHAWPYFIVLLTDAVLRIHDGKTATDVPVSAGHSYLRPAGVTHDVMNGGEHPIAFVEIEVKRPDRLVMAQ